MFQSRMKRRDVKNAKEKRDLWTFCFVHVDLFIFESFYRSSHVHHRKVPCTMAKSVFRTEVDQWLDDASNIDDCLIWNTIFLETSIEHDRQSFDRVLFWMDSMLKHEHHREFPEKFSILFHRDASYSCTFLQCNVRRHRDPYWREFLSIIKHRHNWIKKKKKLFIDFKNEPLSDRNRSYSFDMPSSIQARSSACSSVDVSDWIQ